jgi:hypothetical protein
MVFVKLTLYLFRAFAMVVLAIEYVDRLIVSTVRWNQDQDTGTDRDRTRAYGIREDSPFYGSVIVYRPETLFLVRTFDGPRK